MLHRRLRSALLMPCVLAVLPSGRLLPAGEEKERPYRQFPELPAVLYYEGFESSAVPWKVGKVDTTTIQSPMNAHSFKLGEAEWGKNDKWVTATGDLPGKIPGGMEVGDIHIQFMLWTDDLGELVIKLKDGDFEDKPRPAKAKTWVPVTSRLFDFTKDKKRPPKDAAFRMIDISLKPRDSKKVPNVFIDDFIIAHGAKPMDVLGRAMVLSVKQTAMIRSAAQDGFTCSPQIQDSLQNTLRRSKVRKKPKTVLVVGARANDAQELIKGLNANAPKVKATGFTFVAAAAPDGVSLSGLEDMRTLLPYCAQKTDAEMALLMLGYGDTVKSGRPGDGVRAVLERAIEVGCVPILCLPPSMEGLPQNEKAKLDGFINTINNVCVQLSLPWVDEGFGLKAVENAFDGRELSAKGVEAFSALALQAIKHLDTYVFGRK